MAHCRRAIAGVVGIVLIVAPAAATAGPVASTPSFTGGTARVKTGTPPGGGATVRPSTALTAPLPDPRPHVAVDDAGTAYVTWIIATEATSNTPGSIGFCRLPRGATTCANPPGTRVLTPQKQYGSGDDPAYNQDARSGAYPLVLGDQLFIFSTRDVTTYPTPAGNSTTTTIAFASTDAGNSFSGGLPVSSNLILTARPATFGTGNNPLIGLLGPSAGFAAATDGTAFTSVAGGSFTASGFRLGAADGGVASDESPDALAPLPGGGIAAAWATDPSDGGGGRGLVTTDSAVVRQFPGPGMPSGADAFSLPRSFPFGAGQDTLPTNYERASLASGRAGLLVGTIGGAAPALGLRPLVTPVAGGAPIPLSAEKGEQLRLATGGAVAGGPVVAAWLDSTDFVNGRTRPDTGLYVRRSVDGKTFTAPERLTLRSGGITRHEEAAAPDGGGFSVMQTDAEAGGTVRIVPFGSEGRSALPGLPGTVPGVGTGGPGSPGDGIIRECARIAVGAVQVTTDDGVGCFLPGIEEDKGKSVSNGPVLYNGLRITPLNGSQVVLDIDEATRVVTLYTTGDASVAIPVKAGGDGGDIEIYRGQLKQKLTAKEGEPVLDLPRFPTNVRGFKVAGELAPLALKGGVRIPVDLDLGPQFLGLTGHAELIVDPKTGLRLDTLHIRQAVLPVGPLLVSDLDVSWTKSGGLWTGKAKVTLPTGSAINVLVSFDNSSFSASANYTPVPPIALFGPPPVAYLHELHAGLEVNRNKKPLVVTGGVRIGAVPVTTSRYVLDLDGTVTLTFADPFVMEIRGDLSLLGEVDIASAYLRAGSDNIVKSTFSVGFGDEDWAYIGGSAAVAVGPRGFEGTVNGKICAGIELVSYCQDFPGMFVSSKGVAACAGFLGDAYTISHTFGGGGDTVRRKGDKCFYDDLRVGLLRGASPRAASLRAAGASKVVVPPGAGVLNLNLKTADGVPAVDVVDPSGLAIDLAAADVASSASQHAQSIAIDKPAAGEWAVIPRDGTPALTRVLASVPAPEPVLKATLAPRPVGGRRVVSYAVSANPDATAVFVERTTKGDVPLSGGGGRTGTIRFRPNAQVSGVHQVVARLRDASGIVVKEQVVGRFVQRPPARLRAPRMVRAVRSGAGYRVTVVPAAGFTGRHVVTARFGEGGRASAVLAAGARAARLPGPAKSLDAPGPTRISVAAVSPAGRRGPARTVAVRVAALQRRKVPVRRGPS